MSITDGINRWVKQMTATRHGGNDYPEWVKAAPASRSQAERQPRVSRPVEGEEHWRPPGLA